MDERDVFAQQLVMSMEEAKLSYSKYTTQVRNCIHHYSHVIARWGAVASCWTLITRMIIVPHSFRQVKTVVHRDLVRSRVWSLLFFFNWHNRGEFLFVNFAVVPTKNAPLTPPFSSLALTLDIISCFCIWKSFFNEYLSGEITPSFSKPPLVLSISFHPLWRKGMRHVTLTITTTPAAPTTIITTRQHNRQPLCVIFFSRRHFGYFAKSACAILYPAARSFIPSQRPAGTKFKAASQPCSPLQGATSAYFCTRLPTHRWPGLLQWAPWRAATSAETCSKPA